MNLKQLADHLKLSQTTVSRALNGYSDVSEKTRKRVFAAARAHGYVPSRSARMLATGRSHTIGHVVPLSRHAMINPHFSDFIAGAGEVYAKNDYDMLISVVGEDEQSRLYESMATTGRVDGVIVHGPEVEERRIDLLAELNIPFIVHGRARNPAEGYAWLDVNNRRAFARATRFLIDLGHERIALLNGLEHMNFAHRRAKGYVEALEAANMTVDPAMMFSDEMLESNGHRATLQLMALENPPTAILASSTLLAMGAWRALVECQMRLGYEVSVITYDDQLTFLHNDAEIPTFTSVRSSILKAGRRCAELLIQLIEEPKTPLPTELWESEFVIGNSTGPPLALRQQREDRISS